MASRTARRRNRRARRESKHRLMQLVRDPESKVLVAVRGIDIPPPERRHHALGLRLDDAGRYQAIGHSAIHALAASGLLLDAGEAPTEGVRRLDAAEGLWGVFRASGLHPKICADLLSGPRGRGEMSDRAAASFQRLRLIAGHLGDFWRVVFDCVCFDHCPPDYDSLLDLRRGLSRLADWLRL